MGKRRSDSMVTLRTHRSGDGTWGVEFKIDSGLTYEQKQTIEGSLSDLIERLEKASEIKRR